MYNYGYMDETPKHKTFISFHHDDDYYKNEFQRIYCDAMDGFISKSVNDGDINEYLPTERIRQIIRDDFIRDATVTIVLIGKNTWKRKYVDWEIGSSIRQTAHNPRNGLIGILLPTYTATYDGINPYQMKFTENSGQYNPQTIPPRLANNIECGFSKIYSWPNDLSSLKKWIHEAFQNRNNVRCNPDNSYPSFANNRSEYLTHWS